VLYVVIHFKLPLKLTEAKQQTYLFVFSHTSEICRTHFHTRFLKCDAIKFETPACKQTRSCARSLTPLHLGSTTECYTKSFQDLTMTNHHSTMPIGVVFTMSKNNFSLWQNPPYVWFRIPVLTPFPNLSLSLIEEISSSQSDKSNHCSRTMHCYSLVLEGHCCALHAEKPQWCYPSKAQKCVDASWAPDNPIQEHACLRKHHNASQHCAPSPSTFAQAGSPYNVRQHTHHHKSTCDYIPYMKYGVHNDKSLNKLFISKL
jgi:hypothetical protein